jgi:hypothetical protein
MEGLNKMKTIEVVLGAEMPVFLLQLRFAA